ncbi:alpha/beta hydrolase [Novosphingobium terrae]|uniref:alpha/beta hydrolase n=1 Tax=Novosphingobium terrae TaxID=2726189 RepID=UPI00197CEDDF|nr:alpha/beta hydrolase-fold protein [Novosphingobium terrae]
MASTRQRDFQSTINGEAYRIQVFIPHHAPPPGGYPTIYVLDGNALFGTFAEAVRNRSQAGEIEPAVVVGIASGDGTRPADRTLDFTPKDLTAQEKAIIKDYGPNPPYGGADAFLQVIQQEVKPWAAAQAPLDPKRDILFGWSLGGQFVMHSMLTHPDTFKSWLALSPSLWRSGRAVFSEVPQFQRLTAQRSDTIRLIIGVGGLEEQAPKGMRIGQMSGTELAEELRYVRMVGNAQDMAATLRPYFAARHWPMGFQIFEGQTHNSVPWSAINPFLDFALPIDGHDPGP